jgi:hypothetical protein
VERSELSAQIIFLGPKEIVEQYLFENSLLALPSSCDGEPAPERVLPAILPTEVRPGGFPKGDLTEEEEFGSSMGEVLPVDDPERGCSIIEAGRYPRVGCSDLEEVII